MIKKEKIGFFDSGLGGLTVLSEVLKLYPDLDFVYFGDNINAPYGQKSQDEIIGLTEDALRFLKKKGCSKIITACNSVSSVVNFKLAEKVGLKRENILEMSSPTIDYCLDNNIEEILILSTEVTKKSGLYSRQLLESGIKSEHWAINGLVDLIEANQSDLAKKNIIKKELEGLNFQKHHNVILACTHFPLVENIFKEVFLEKIKKLPNFINPAVFVARKAGDKFNLKNAETNEAREFYFSKKTKTIDIFLRDF